MFNIKHLAFYRNFIILSELWVEFFLKPEHRILRSEERNLFGFHSGFVS